MSSGIDVAIGKTEVVQRKVFTTPLLSEVKKRRNTKQFTKNVTSTVDLRTGVEVVSPEVPLRIHWDSTETKGAVAIVCWDSTKRSER